MSFPKPSEFLTTMETFKKRCQESIRELINLAADYDLQIPPDQYSGPFKFKITATDVVAIEHDPEGKPTGTYPTAQWTWDIYYHFDLAREDVLTNAKARILRLYRHVRNEKPSDPF